MAEAAPETAAEPPALTYEQKKKLCSKIANPLADEKLCKKVLKLARKAAKKKQIKRGVKEVVKALRKKVAGCACYALPQCESDV
jgi:H/ACA ribonucleoprotein complex subunit 2